MTIVGSLPTIALMTADARRQHSHGAASVPEAARPAHVRLVTQLPQPLDQRLRLLAALSRKSVTAVLAEILHRGLPTAEELATRVKGAPR